MAIHLGTREVIRFNLAVIGESGLGKTTLLKALLQKYSPVNEILKDNVSILTSPTVIISEVGDFLANTESGPIHFYLYDTPGYGDFVNNQASFDMCVIVLHISLLNTLYKI